MPGVTVLPSSPGLGGLGTPLSPNGFARSPADMTVSEVKERAREEARKHIRGASPLSLIGTTRKMSLLGQECELSGEYKGALAAWTKALVLLQSFMDSAEFKAEQLPGKRGVLYRELTDFQQHEGKDLFPRVQTLEAKMQELEKASPSVNGVDSPTSPDGPNQKPGGSIADRMRQLQENGLSVGATKRFSREVPQSPAIASPTTSHRYTQSLSSPAISPSVSASASSTSSHSPHALVPASSLGPPSPGSTPTSSPQNSNYNLSEFSQAFPSIDELDEFELKSPPPPSITPVKAQPSPVKGAFRPFPTLPVDPGPRPSSTPIPPLTHALVSRPASPAKLKPKPSGLGLHESTLPERTEKSPLPVMSSIVPGKLREYLEDGKLKVLLLDVRTREEYEREHINAPALVCLEPSVLMRENVTGSTIEDALSVGAQYEKTLFANREKFDLVAIYDSSSSSYGAQDSALSRLFRAIYELEFRKTLKHTPVLLIGGFEAWKAELGEQYVVRGEMDTQSTGGAKSSASTSASAALSSGVLPAPMTASPAPAAPLVSDSARYWASSTPAEPADKRPSSSSSALPSINGQLSGDHGTLLSRRPALSRPPTSSTYSSTYPRGSPDSTSVQHTSSPMPNGSSAITYPSFPQRVLSPNSTGQSSFANTGGNGIVSPPPQASLNTALSRRRSDYVDQSQEALSGSGLSARTAIDYPSLLVRPPPAAASSALERQDNRPRVALNQPRPPTIQSEYPVTYWPDLEISTAGLKNLGNTCYMNSTIQCLSATVPFARFFTDGRWKSALNLVNPLGSKGNLAAAFASILHQLWQGEDPYLSPIGFRRSICMHAPQFGGSDQHDSQEFLVFLLDGLHEDLNRVLQKPNWQATPEHEAELERMPQQIASEQEWKIYRMRNDSLIVDWFHGQFRNRLECLTCHKTSTTYNSFMYLTLPVPAGRGSTKVDIYECLREFVKEEVMEKSDSWHCPNCKALRRATKRLSISRLPPVLLIHLKRFSFKGPFTDKIETFVDFPLRGLDLTNFLPPPLPPGADKTNKDRITSADDPRAQVPPYRYNLYGVTNHFGSLNTGHYTAFIASRGGWLYCDDSRVTPTQSKEVVGKPAYVLYYKRTKA